ncbi:Charged multivesicular body protein 2b [Blastocladiella emersonii ATCC 22665]|nr:Charged multivesicular body protein 2b [Blastocladiella emersonii ATCC 22665]
MAEKLKSAVGLKPDFRSHRMAARDTRIKEAKTFADQGNRELARERSTIDRKEAKLLSEVKKLVQRGDLHGARQLAKQIAMYRRIGARSFEASVAIDVKLQAMSSNNKINKRHMETLKSIQYVNGGSSLKDVANREYKAMLKMEECNAMEAIMNEGMDEIYSLNWDDEDGDTDDAAHLVGARSGRVSDIEVDSIVSQALDSSQAREYFEHAARSGSGAGSGGKLNSVVFIKVHGQPGLGTSIPIDSLELSVDMVKRALSKDPFAVHQLGLALDGGAAATKGAKGARAAVGCCRPFVLGRVDAETGEFEALPIDASLKRCGVRAKEVLHIKTLD